MQLGKLQIGEYKSKFRKYDLEINTGQIQFGRRQLGVYRIKSEHKKSEYTSRGNTHQKIQFGEYLSKKIG